MSNLQELDNIKVTKGQIVQMLNALNNLHGDYRKLSTHGQYAFAVLEATLNKILYEGEEIK